MKKLIGKIFFFTCLLGSFPKALLAAPLAYEVPPQSPQPYGALPTINQVNWFETEYFGLIHYGLNSYEGKEWGYGNADPKLFNPTHLDTDQWAKTAKEAGLKGLILVAKHHDGFCLWQTKTTSYSIAASPWKGGKGDLVDDFVKSCKKFGLKYGIYISPWDRNHSQYGMPEYVKVYHAQWQELLSQYGNEIFELWFDGANGGDGYYGGAKEHRTIPKDYYQYEKLFDLIDRLAPKAVLFGGTNQHSVRWVGNESGLAAKENWATLTDSEGKEWFRPDEADTTLLFPKKWFYNPTSKARTLTQMVELYHTTVGRNACLSLGLSPDLTGQIPKDQVSSLMALQNYLKKSFADDLMQKSRVKCSSTRGLANGKSNFSPRLLSDKNSRTFWATEEGESKAEILIALPPSQGATLKIVMQEPIALGQRIAKVEIAAATASDNDFKLLLQESTVGYKRILTIPNEGVNHLKITLQAVKEDLPIALSTLEIYSCDLPVPEPQIERNALGLLQFSTNEKRAKTTFFYSLDGSPFMEAKGLIAFKEGGVVQAYTTIKENGIVSKSEITEKRFGKIVPFSRTEYKQGTFITTFPQPTMVKGFFYEPLPFDEESSFSAIQNYRFSVYHQQSGWILIKEGSFDNIKNNPIRQEQFINLPFPILKWKLEAIKTVDDKKVSGKEPVGIY